jgi:hypothetical protein
MPPAPFFTHVFTSFCLHVALCFVFCVLCFVFCVLCFGVLVFWCFCVFCVLCIRTLPSFMFGGAGALTGGIRPILSEFWQYVPTTGVWVSLNALPVVNALAPPVGRYECTSHHFQRMPFLQLCCATRVIELLFPHHRGELIWDRLTSSHASCDEMMKPFVS